MDAMALHITDDAAADELLTDNPLALLVGMLLDQQIAMETAFTGPLKIEQRTGSMDAAALASYDPDALASVFKETPAVHRFPGSMAARVQSLTRTHGVGIRSGHGAYISFPLKGIRFPGLICRRFTAGCLSMRPSCSPWPKRFGRVGPQPQPDCTVFILKKRRSR